jgi:hypothetical protein
VCIDYPRFVDVVRLRLHLMRVSLRAEAEEHKLVQDFICTTPACGSKRYTSLDAATIFDPLRGEFACEDCGCVLTQDMGQGVAGDAETRKRRKDEARALLARLEIDAAPLEEALRRAQRSGVAPPDFGSLEEWVSARRAQALLEAKQAKPGYRGPMGGRSGREGTFEFLEDTQIEVQLQEDEPAEALAAGRGVPVRKAPRKPAPPWLRRQGAAEAAEELDPEVRLAADPFAVAYVKARLQMAAAGAEAAAAAGGAQAAPAGERGAEEGGLAPAAAGAAMDEEEDAWEDVG